MIFGFDNRLSATDNTNASVMVRITAYYHDGSTGQGSGVMIGANDVLTAAHMIYDPIKGWASSVLVIANQQDTWLPFGAASASQLSAPDAWRNQQDYAHDYGVISLSTPLGYQTGWIELDKQAVTVSQGNFVTSIGYPGDLKPVQPYLSMGSIDKIANGIVYFYDDMDAAGGQSGSPVMTFSGKVIGVISHQGANPTSNAAVLLEQSKLQQILTWVTENDSQLPAPLPLTVEWDYQDYTYLYRLYDSILNRTPDVTGLTYWLTHLDQGMSREDVKNHFLQSSEFQSQNLSAQAIEVQITNLYQTLLHRSPDDEGLTYWSQRLSSDMTLQQLRDAIANSSEYNSKIHIPMYQYWHENLQAFGRTAYGTNNGDHLTGTSQDDLLVGWAGNDTLEGSDGNDYLYGGSGNDLLTGGTGSDYFAFASGETGHDIITDFNLGEDMLRFRDSALTYQISTTTQGWLKLVTADYSASITFNGIMATDYTAIMIV